MKIVTGKLIRKDILEKQLSDDLEDLKSLPMQGAFVDIKNADYLLSQNTFRSFKISANLVSFWYKSRHNILPCHYALSLWYLEHSPECRLDGYRLESISHVLNGCKEVKSNCSKRHDTILDKVVSKVKHHCNEILVNKTIRGSFKEFTEESEHRSELNLKPDIVIKGKTGVRIIDIVCLYDLYIDSAYTDKLKKYQCVKEFLGSLGTVHNKALNILTKHRMNKKGS